ncbi:Pkinase-domain-containing protein [Basidiobolus meristosporus CBS 931.73]|uniref:non-specific serine/threonine protein kinase n=1 Tax=Basidiobolus meristosporus CBS 931.73 TaxID=1314790 RepID=A0A1Y1XU67_9FUNG|nr:Pkinase-domain-containing protein [Basidiobolus meristosporus CBS 931.73]|eukprot:ORX89301.1 Pkinase-domain-containing protein [Basidiobolus meristosporus CBS 931.73]
MGPEILRYEKYDAKADLWSVGAVLYELVVGKPPFRAQNHVELLKRIEKCNDHIKFPGEVSDSRVRRRDSDDNTASIPYSDSSQRKTTLVSEELKDLIRHLLKRNPAERLSFEDFFAHPCIIGMSRSSEQNVEIGNVGIAKYLCNTRRSASFDLPNSRYAPLGYALRRPSYEISTERIQRPFSLGLMGSKPRSYDPRMDFKSNRNATADQRNPSLHDEPASPSSSLLLNPTTVNIKLKTPRARANKTENNRDKDQTTISNKTEDEILFEREYVVIEKRAVEVNALADELAASPRLTNQTVRNPASSSSTTIPPPFRKPEGTALYYLARAESTPTINKMEYDSPTTALGSRDRGAPPTTGWASGATPSALAKAISTASARLLGRTGSHSPPHRDLSFSKGDQRNSEASKEEDLIISGIESSAYKAHAIFHLANLKFLELTPPHPESTKDSETPLSEEEVEKIGGEAFALYLKTLSLLQAGLDAAKKYWDNVDRNHTGVKTTSSRLNDAVQWMRDKFNESLEKAEFIKLKVTIDEEHSICVEKLMYDYALETSRAAAVDELVGENLTDCERSYQTAIWILSALLTVDEDNAMDEEDRRTITKFIGFISNRLSSLRRKMSNANLKNSTSA